MSTDPVTGSHRLPRRDLLSRVGGGFGLLALAEHHEQHRHDEDSRLNPDARGHAADERTEQEPARPHPPEQKRLRSHRQREPGHVAHRPKAAHPEQRGEDRKSTRLNSSHVKRSRMPSSA